MTYEQFKTILEALEANLNAADAILGRRPMSATALFREKQAEQAIATLRTVFNQPTTVIYRKAS